MEIKTTDLVFEIITIGCWRLERIAKTRFHLAKKIATDKINLTILFFEICPSVVESEIMWVIWSVRSKRKHRSFRNGSVKSSSKTKLWVPVKKSFLMVRYCPFATMVIKSLPSQIPPAVTVNPGLHQVKKLPVCL